VNHGGRAVPALSLLLFFAAGTLSADLAADLLATGRKALGDSQYSLAVTSLGRVVAELPESPQALEAEYLLGVALFYAERWADSLDTLGGFRARHTGSSLAQRAAYWMAASSLKLKRYAIALEHLGTRDFLADASDPYRYHEALLAGIALEALGRDSEASRYYRKIVDDRVAALAPEASFRLAGTEYRAGDFAAARNRYGKILLDDPRSPYVRDCVFFLAECELALGNPAEAEKRYQTLLSLYPDSAYRDAAMYRLADAAWRQGRQQPALDRLDSFQKQFASGPYVARALKLRADILLAQKKYAPAAAEYQKAIAALGDGPDLQGAFFSKGVAELALGRTQEAAESFARAGQGSARDVGEKAEYQVALLHAGANQDVEAIASLDRYLTRFPTGANTEEAARLLASLLEKRGDTAAALARWDLLVKSFSRSAMFSEYLFRRASVLLRQSRFSDALDDFQRLRKEYPGSPWRAESSYAIGWVYSQRGEYARALPFFEEAAGIKASGETAERGRLSVGICLFNMSSFDRALASLQALERDKPKSLSSGTIALYIGRTFYRLERLQEAASRLADAASLLGSNAPEAADAWYWLGWAQLRLNRLTEARDAFLEVSERFPADPRSAEALFRAGICETMRAQDGAAVGLFDRVLALRVDDVTREQAMYERAWALWRLGRKPEAHDALQALSRGYPAGRLAPEAWFRLAEEALRENRYDEARAGFARVSGDFPKSALAVQALYWSAETLRRSGDARGSLEGYWSCFIARPGLGIMEAARKGFQEALRAAGSATGGGATGGSAQLARLFVTRVQANRALSAEAAAGVLLDCAATLLPESPREASAAIDEARRRAPPEPLAGEASLMQGIYYAATSDWQRALDVFAALGNSRADEVGARAVRERGLALEAVGRTSEAIDELLKIPYLFPDYGDIAAEGLFQAVRIARARGDKERAARIEQSLRKGYPGSPWVEKLGAP
jgi:TolA-binding protein